MADSFELLKAKVTIDVAGVKLAVAEVAKLQTALKGVAKPVKLNVKAPKAASSASQTKDANKLAESIAKIQVAAAKAELSTKNLTSKMIRLTRLRADVRGLIRSDSTPIQKRQVLQLEKQLKAAQDRIKARSLQNSRIQITADNAAARAQAKATKDAERIAEKARRTAESVARAQIKAAQNAAKATERIRLQSINRVIRAAQKAQIAARDPKTNELRRTQLLKRAEELLIRVRQRVSATSKEAILIEQRLSAVRRASEPGIARLAAKLRALADVSAGVSGSPGITRFVGQLGRLSAGLLRGAANLSGMSASAASLTIGLGALVVGTALMASALIKLASAAVNAASAIGRAVLSGAITVLTRALKVILTPLRAAYTELSRLFTIAGLRAFSNEALELAGRMEQVQQQLKLRFGDAAQQEFARLRDEANLFGTDLVELSAGFARFALATEGAGISIQTIRDLFTGIQASARVFGTSVEDISGIFRAFEQIAGKGKLTSEELIRQLGDRLPGAFKLAADALGKTPAELVDSLRQGTVSAKQFFDAFSRETVTRFYAKAISLSDTLNARFARLRNIRNLIFIGAGDFISNTFIFALERIAQAAIRMRDAFKPISAVISRITAAFRKSIASMNFEVLFNRLATLFTAMGPVIEQFMERLGRIAIVFNGAVLVAAFAVIQIAITKINDLMGQFLANLQKLTGIDFSTAERSFAAVAAAISVLPEIVAGATRVWEKFREVVNKFFSDAAINMRSLIKIWAAAELIKNPAKALGIAFALKKIDDIIDKMKTPLEGDDGLSATVAKELELALAKIAEAQKNMQLILEGKDGKGKNDASDAINEAADNLRDAMSGKASEILDPLEWVRRLNAATFKANIDAPQVAQQKQVKFTEQTAKNTSEILGILKGGKVTPLHGRAVGVLP